MTYYSLFRIFNPPKSELLSFYYYGELEIDGKNQLEGLHITTNIFGIIDNFRKESKLYQIVGNHDRELQDSYPEGCRFKNKETGKEIFWHHGYGDDFINDILWKITRDFIRYAMAPAEDILKFRDAISPARTAERHAAVKRTLKEWVATKNVTSIFGHIHHSEQDGLYNNDGCWVSPGVITCLEVTNDQPILKEWQA